MSSEKKQYSRAYFTELKMLPGPTSLYFLIAALADQKDYCGAGSKYFMDFFNIDKNTLKRWKKDLVKKGMIKIEVGGKDGKEKSKIYLCYERPRHTKYKNNTVTTVTAAEANDDDFNPEDW